MTVSPAVYAQEGFRCRFDWGRRGARHAAERGDIVVIVDVLRFTSAVATAAQYGAIVYPCDLNADVKAMALRMDAVAASKSAGADGRFSLSPASFVDAAHGARVVVPSPNGAMCTMAARSATRAFAASLLNATAVAQEVSRLLEASDLSVTVVASGERWADDNEDGALRFALEDYLGAGAVLSRIARVRSPEAVVCAAAFEASRGDVPSLLWECASGRELRAMGREQDVRDCARLDVYDAVPVLRDGRYERL